MTHRGLEQLSEAELVEIVLRQHATILQQQASIEQLPARVATLEDQIRRLIRPPTDGSRPSTSPP